MHELIEIWLKEENMIENATEFVTEGMVNRLIKDELRGKSSRKIIGFTALPQRTKSLRFRWVGQYQYQPR